VRRGCWLYLSSDVPDMVAAGTEQMTAVGFESWGKSEATTAAALPLACWEKQGALPQVDNEGLLGASPLGNEAPSEREIVCQLKWRKVYRIAMIKP